MKQRQYWYPVVNDLIGGWAVSEHDKPMSEHDTANGEHAIADFMEKRTARAVASLLNLHGYTEE